MSSMLAIPVAAETVDPSNASNFFTLAEVTQIDRIHKARECDEPLSVPPKCNVNLVQGFFFDGTN